MGHVGSLTHVFLFEVCVSLDFRKPDSHILNVYKKLGGLSLRHGLSTFFDLQKVTPQDLCKQQGKSIFNSTQLSSIQPGKNQPGNFRAGLPAAGCGADAAQPAGEPLR